MPGAPLPGACASGSTAPTTSGSRSAARGPPGTSPWGRCGRGSWRPVRFWGNRTPCGKRGPRSPERGSFEPPPEYVAVAQQNRNGPHFDMTAELTAEFPPNQNRLDRFQRQISQRCFASRANSGAREDVGHVRGDPPPPRRRLGRPKLRCFLAPLGGADKCLHVIVGLKGRNRNWCGCCC